jgi:osmoprotectant transport system substrate-binding protein
MTSLTGSFRTKLIAIFFVVVMLALSACSGVASTSSGGNSGGSQSKGTITVASKKDTESQLLAEMYALLLQKKGYTVNLKLSYGNTPFNFQAIQNGSTDLYPEFTATGLNLLNIPSTYDPQKDYQAVKNGFEQKYQITWLDAAPLNDGYAICTSKSQSQSLGITTISQLAPKVGQYILETPSDGVDFVNNLQKTYGFSTKSFKKTQTVDYTIGFTAVQHNQAQFNVCYGTDATVPQQNFVFLQDDKNGFPAFNPAPIVRDSVLKKYSDIPSILNPLAPKLTTDVSIQLQNNVAKAENGGAATSGSIKQVAQQFLQQQGLL